MNMFKKLAAVFLCVVAVVNAEEGTRIGIRLGYSMQSVAYNMGMLGLRAGVEADIPIGPVFISPEVDFLYRNNWNTSDVTGDRTQPEFAVSIPLMVKFLFGSSSFIAIGAQADIPIDARECLDDKCSSMDGKSNFHLNPYLYKRADFDVGIVLSSGYIITPNLTLDIRCVYGVTPHYTYDNLIREMKSSPMYSYGFGLTYFL